jgi:hypothetical protein
MCLYPTGLFIAANKATERYFMKTARVNVSILTLRATLKRFLDEYESFDAARRLCADYCITTNDMALMMGEIPKPERTTPRLTFAIRSDKIIDIDEAYLVAR